MLGGTHVTDKALAHAREMLSTPGASSDTAKLKRGAARPA
jgi:hypothetical protein